MLLTHWTVVGRGFIDHEFSRIIDSLMLTDDLVLNAKPPVPAVKRQSEGYPGEADQIYWLPS